MGPKSGVFSQLLLAWRHNRRGLFSGGHLMMLSHMRALSSPLAQVLGGHPEICGHGEQCRSYQSRSDFLRVRMMLGATDASSPPQHYYLDQVLHGRFAVDPRLLHKERSRILIVVRRPETTLPQLVNSRRSRRRSGRFANPAMAASYYVARLESIAAIAQAAPCPKVFVPSETLATNHTGTLAALTKWLQLEQPLTARYRVFEDGSDLSPVGRDTGSATISPASPPAGTPEPGIPPGVIEQCVGTYDRFCAVVNEFCETLPFLPQTSVVD